MASPLLSKRLLPWRLAVTLLAAINIAAVVFIFLHIDFNNAPELYFPSDAPSVKLDQSLRKEFPSDEFLIGAFAGEDLYSGKVLTALNQVAKQMEKHPLVDRVFSVTNVDHIAATEDGFAVEVLIDTKRLAASTPAQHRARIIADRFAPGLIAAKDGSALAILVRPKDLSQSRQRESIEHAFHQAVKAAGLEQHLVSLAGPIALDTAQLRSMLADSLVLIPLTMIIGIALLAWVVGRVVPVVIGAIAMSTVVTTSVAALTAIGQPYTLVSAMIPPLLAAYTIATLLHLYASLFRARQARLHRPRRVIRAVQDVHTAALFNVLTTGAGMASLVLTPIPPVQVFGLTGAIGTLAVYLVVFHLIPPLLAQWDRGPWPKHGGGFRWTKKIAYTLASFAMRRAGATLAIAAVGVVAVIPLLMKVQVESDLLKFFPEKHRLTQSTQFVESRFSGVINLEIVMDGTGRDSLKDINRLLAIKDFQRWAETQPHIDRTVSMMDVIEEMNWAFHGEDAQYRSLPDNNKLLSQLLLVYDGKDLHELVNREYQRTRILLNVNAHGANAIGKVIGKIKERLESHPIPGVKWDIAGYGRLFSDQEDLLVIGQVKSFLGAFVQIFILLVILWRSFIAAGICLIPNLAPLYFIFAVMGATGISLDMATCLIAGVVLGITVDDTIHLYHSYLHRLRQGASPVFALARSFEASGRAVIAVSIVLVAQFTLLTASQFQPTADFGLLAAIGLLAGQLFELLLLPALIVVWNRYAPPKPITARS